MTKRTDAFMMEHSCLHSHHHQASSLKLSREHKAKEPCSSFSACKLLLDQITHIKIRLEAEAVSSDILFQDEHVCVLKPGSDKGVIVYHKFPDELQEVINRDGLVLGVAHSNGERTNAYPYHFFRAPASYASNHPPNPTFECVNAAYANKMVQGAQYFCIRIDPDHTSIYLSETRAVFNGTEMWRNSRMTPTEFTHLIEKNKTRKGDKYQVISGIKSDTGQSKNYVDAPPERNAEILVSCNIPPSWRVHLA
jgi:hypothetical protein